MTGWEEPGCTTQSLPSSPPLMMAEEEGTVRQLAGELWLPGPWWIPLHWSASTNWGHWVKWIESHWLHQMTSNQLIPTIITHVRYIVCLQPLTNTVSTLFISPTVGPSHIWSSSRSPDDRLAATLSPSTQTRSWTSRSSHVTLRLKLGLDYSVCIGILLIKRIVIPQTYSCSPMRKTRAHAWGYSHIHDVASYSLYG